MTFSMLGIRLSRRLCKHGRQTEIMKSLITDGTLFFFHRIRFRMGEKKAPLLFCINEINLESQKVHKVLFFNQDLKYICFENIVVWLGLVKPYHVGNTSAPPSFCSNPQTIAGRDVFVEKNMVDFLFCPFGEKDWKMAVDHDCKETSKRNEIQNYFRSIKVYLSKWKSSAI